MIRILPILSKIISEQKRFKFDTETYSKLTNLTDKLWSVRNDDFTKKTQIDQLTFKTSDGSEGLVKVFINTRLPYFAQLDSRPKDSLDPKKLIIQLNPNKFGSKKNLFLTLFHEMLHATDPSQTTKYNEKFQSTYSTESDESYWGHKIEFRAVTNEFLEALVNEFTKRFSRLKNPENKRYLMKSLNNILDYFAKNTKLSKLSLDILDRLNDENLSDSKISKLLGNISMDYPQTTELFTKKKQPYFLTYIEMIKKFNPQMWPRFLTMLYNTKQEIESIVNKTNI